MELVRRNGTRPSKYWVRFGIAAVLSFTGSGCAGLGSFRGNDYPFLGGFWDYGKAEEVFPGGDVYAQQMNEGRARAEARQADAGSGDRGKDSSAKPEGPGKKDDSKPRLSDQGTRARADQDTVRVTLGRPESLPVVAGIPPNITGKTAVVSAAPQWKKESKDSADRDREIVDRHVEPARRRTESLLAAVAPRNLTAPARQDAPGSLAETNEEKGAEILERALSKLESLTSYQVSMSRVERVGSRLQPEETVLLSIRRSPRAVRLQWDDGPSKGREVIYSTALDDSVIHVNTVNGGPLSIPRMSIAVDSPLIMRNSRHSIKEAGFDTILNHMSGRSSDPGEPRGSSGGKAVYTGKVTPEGGDRACHRFVRTTADGERWEVLLDVKSLLPHSVIAHDAQGELLERYTYQDVKENPVELAAADAFDPDTRWGKPKGLFSRLAGAAASAGAGDDAASTTR